MGDSGVGKTSYIKRLKSIHYDISMVQPTIGVMLETYHILNDRYKVAINVHDPAGQERFRSLARNYYKQANAVIIMFDLTELESWEGVKYWFDELNEFANDNIKLIVVGNKTDKLFGGEQPTTKIQSEIDDLISKYNTSYYMISAKTGNDVSRSFCHIVKMLYDNIDDYKSTGLNTKKYEQKNIYSNEIRDKLDGNTAINNITDEMSDSTDDDINDTLSRGIITHERLLSMSQSRPRKKKCPCKWW